MDIISSEIVKTRKDHRCWGCTKKIKKGSNVSRTVSADGGYIMQAYWCSKCVSILSKHYDYNDEIMEGELLEYHNDE